MASDEAIQNMKEQIERLEKAIEDAQATNAELANANTQLSTENKTLQAKGLFRDLKYSTKQAELFVQTLGEDGEITEEAVREFAEAYDLSPLGSESGSEGEEGAGEGEPKTDDSNLSSMARAGSRSGAGSPSGVGKGSMTRDEWMQLQKENPAAADQALKGGRVQLREDNFYRQRGLVRSPE